MIKMAAPCRKLARTAMDGFYRFSTSKLCTRHSTISSPVQVLSSLRSQQWGIQGRPLHSVRYPLLCSAKAEHQKETETVKTTNDPKRADEEKEDYRPEYIPKARKTKNPLKKIGFAWMIGLPGGVIMFILAKREVDKNRLKQLKIRQRMKKANEDQYKPQRYNPSGIE